MAATVGPHERAAAPTARERIHQAPRIVVVAAALGVGGQILFFGTGLGLNVPLAAAAIIVAGWRLRVDGRSVAWRDLCLPAAALAFATFFALRGDGMVLAFDLVAAVLLTAASLIAFSGRRVVARPTGELAAAVAEVAGATAVSAVDVIGSVDLPTAAAWRDRSRGLASVGRGLLIGVPLAVVAGVLFASADATFASLVEDLVNVDLTLGDVPGRVLVALAIGWAAAGALSVVVAAPAVRAVGPARVGTPPRLGATEAFTALLVLDLVFAVFVVLQAAYLFGGLDTLAATGLTYAEYARRGFFELVAVAVLAGSTVLALETLVARRPRRYVAAAVVLAVLTGVVLSSAAYRLQLYQQAYGWTELRFYVLTAICFLAAGLVLAIVALLSDRSRRLPHRLIALGLVVAFAVNVIGPVRFVTQANLDRAIDPSLVPPDGRIGLDVEYVADLDWDAVVPLVRALPDLPSDVGARLERALLQRRAFVEQPQWQEWTLSRHFGAGALAQLDAER